MNRLSIAVLGLAACAPVQADPADQVCHKQLFPPDGESEYGGKSLDDLGADASKATPIAGTCDVRLRDNVETAVLAGKPGAKAAAHAWDHKGKVEYYDLVTSALAITDDEQRQLARDGMVVPARLAYENYSSAYYDIHRGQLPIYVSADSILHAIYVSHDELLASLEENVLIHNLDDALGKMQCQLGAVAKDYPKEVAEDLDLYLLVARKLLQVYDSELTAQVAPSIEEKAAMILQAIDEASGVHEIELFGRKRAFDATMYTPRGHYERMPGFFHAAMWLSRMEFNLSSRDTRSSTPGYFPDTTETPREAVDALALADLADRSGALADLGAIDRAWGAFAGMREDVPLADLLALRKQAGIGKLSIPDSANKLRAAIGKKYQRSVNIFPNPNVQRLPAIATAIGPRVTFDTIALAAVPVNPDPAIAAASVAYMLGNDRALAYTGKTEKRDLQAARTAFATQKPNANLYSIWLDAIVTLSHPVKGAQPSYAKTNAYADLRLDSMLAGYGELRHNYVLINSQLYDVGGCEIPDGYVEPVPETYEALERWAANGERVFAQLDPAHKTKGEKYFARVEQLMKLLATISRHELAGNAPTADEKRFLAMAVEMREAEAWNYTGHFPVPTYDGWYMDLFPNADAAFHTASFIADYATHDRENIGRWIDYLGARGPRLGLFIVDAAGAPRLMVGPVAQAFAVSGPLAKRFTDEDAATVPSVAPWAASYTAAAPAAPHLKVRAVVPMSRVADKGNMRSNFDRTTKLKALGVAEGMVAFDSDKDLGDVTLELRDHHFVKLTAMTVHVTAGHTEVKLARLDGVESLLVRAGAFRGRVDFTLQGIAEAEFGAKN